MPTIAYNRGHWGKKYAWPNQGDEWSALWGGPFAQWHWSIRPRIAHFVPTSCILEIAPGLGRWTQFLLPECEKFYGVDLNPKCVETCRRRFADCGHGQFYQNDGKSLDMLTDGSVDFAFSFDSLVHVEEDVLGEYLRQLRMKLKPDGVGFFHHSNIGSYQRWWSWRSRLFPSVVRKILTRRGWMQHHQSRAFSVRQSKMRELCEASGLLCAHQELINWKGSLLIDCLTTFGRENSKLTQAIPPLKNRDYMKAASYIRNLASIYRQGRAYGGDNPQDNMRE
jgi:2-polyprenyl-3-methyl-5-hydroxy-6-metoxy-1,4-benzoquinol methylase